MSDWCTIESDPGVFTSLIESFGVENAQLTELWSLDDDSLSNLVSEYGKVYGLIFLFKWQSNANANTNASTSNTTNDSTITGKPLSSDEVPEDLFFAKQVTTNACATQAILSVLFNSASSSAVDGNNNIDMDDNVNVDANETDKKTSKLVLGPTLEALKTFTSSFPADLKGEAIGASDDIREAHNSFARKEAFLIDDSQKRTATDDDDVFHFIAYVPHGKNESVYELDGLQPGPILSGVVEGGDSNDTNDLAWLQVARSAIQTRIEKYAATEIKFNLMALTADKRIGIQSKIKTLVDAGINEGDESIAGLQADLANEEDMRQQWKEENERRRHNYLPLCMELIRALAGSGKLPECTDKAKERVTELRKKMLKQKMTNSMSK
jgi:ubiquitin carboxyl-terminal hydrolase L5